MSSKAESHLRWHAAFTKAADLSSILGFAGMGMACSTFITVPPDGVQDRLVFAGAATLINALHMAAFLWAAEKHRRYWLEEISRPKNNQ
jgi:hypothetical protein